MRRQQPSTILAGTEGYACSRLALFCFAERGVSDGAG
jgi:hypothetical protein